MQLQKKVIISVVSDLVTDQRVHRSAETLHQNGFEVTLVGRCLKKSLSLEKRNYKTHRFKLVFEKGPLFYASYNFRLFFYLLFHKADFYLSNDLDTLPANYVVSRLKRIELVYDSHEYFTEVPELVNRPKVRKIWLSIERWIFPRLKRAMTVNESIAKVYIEKYNVKVKSVRNLPFLSRQSVSPVDRKEWSIPPDAVVFLFQGAGINVDRGAEEAIDAIQKVDGAVLLFIGSGDVFDRLKKNVHAAGLTQKIFFVPKQPFRELIRFTRMADFGLTLDKDTNLNYRFSLPNKLFDYVQAGLPVLATDLPEVKKIIQQYDIGLISPSSDSSVLADKMKEMMNGDIDKWKKNLKLAADELCWEKEEGVFLDMFKNETD